MASDPKLLSIILINGDQKVSQGERGLFVQLKTVDEDSWLKKNDYNTWWWGKWLPLIILGVMLTCCVSGIVAINYDQRQRAKAKAEEQE
jgi:hypothetical protein